MAVSSQDILNFLLANPNMSDRDIAAAMDMYGVTPAMMAQAVGIPVEQVQQRYEDVKPQGLLAPQEPIKTPEPVYVPEPVYTPEPTPEPAYVAYSEPTYQESTQPEPQQTQEAQTMAVTSKQIVDFLLANPNMSDAQIVSTMDQYGVTPAQMAQAVGLPVAEVQQRYQAVAAPVAPVAPTPVAPAPVAPAAITNQQIIDYLNVNPNITGSQLASVMTEYNVSPAQIASALAENVAQFGTQTQTLANNETGQTDISLRNLGAGFNAYQDESGQLSYSRVDPARPGMIQLYGPNGEYRGEEKITTTTQDLIRNLGPIALAAGGTALAQGLLGGAATGATGTGLEFAGSGGAFDLANASIAGGTSSFTAAELAAIQAAQTAGTAAGATGLLTPAVTSAVSPTVATTTAASTLPAATAATTAATALTPAATTLTPAVTSTLSPLVKAAIPAITGALTSTPNSLTNLFSGGLGTAGSLLQMQQSKEAAQAAQQRIDAETAAAKAASQFRPVGMTTRFGTSQFAVDPVTGQLTSAGYTLSPEAKNAQDRLVKLAESGLQQAEGAQAQFAPLQTGAQRLFGLGNQYLAQSPQDVAQNYLNQQMALLQPGRELELANLQNRLQQQGRGGLSVAQGGTLGATTPELQALFNARAQQEAQLAANAQQAGQQQVAFGAGLLGTGAQTMGQYYGGQQAAYSPYTTALGQVQNLESMAQQPLQMGVNLGQISSQAGANVGKLGLTGAQLSTNLATGADATRNLAAQGLIAAGNPNAMFGQAIGGLFGGGLQSAFSGTGLGSSGFGTGLAYGNQDLGLFL